MMPSMFSGVSGLRNHQTRMNVIGNNLANINTVGFKYSRVTFSDMMYQTMKSASGPAGGRGGINPQQVGLGMLVNTIDTVHTQGNLEATGKLTDMAIQGEGFFILSDGTNRWYTRSGAFALGVDGSIINPANGLLVQGWRAVNGVVDTSSVLGSVAIKLGEVLQAQPTSQVEYVGNLNAAGSLALGTITSTGALLAAATGVDPITTLKNSAGVNLGVQAGNTITISGSVGGVPFTRGVTVTGATTLALLASEIQTAIGTAGVTAAVQPDGSIQVNNASGVAVTNLQLSIAGNSVFGNAFVYPSTIAAGASGNSNTLRAAATATDTLMTMFDAQGNSLGLLVNDDLTLLNASVRGSARSNVPIITNITNATTYEQYRAALQNALFSAFPLAGEGVTIEADGSLRITGAPGAQNGVSGINIGAGPNPGDDVRAMFRAAQLFTESQAAVDAASFATSVQVFDSLGAGHSVTIRFTKEGPNSWSWNATADGGTASVGSGMVSFNAAGQNTATTGSISIPVTNGATTPLNITPDFSNIFQLAGEFSVAARSQDGYPMGVLDKYEVSTSGLITGFFTNGLNQVMGQIAMAKFSNPSGLNAIGENLFTQSTNSGIAQVGEPGSSGRGTIAVGTLEMSNVDIAREFTNMIITERGFQANSRVITTSDQMLQELVNLKR